VTVMIVGVLEFSDGDASVSGEVRWCGCSFLFYCACGGLWIMCLLCWWSVLRIELVVEDLSLGVVVLSSLGRLDALCILRMIEERFYEV